MSLSERHIMATREEPLTASETSIVSGVPLKAVYKVARERLPGRLIVHKGGKILFKHTAAVCFRIDHGLPKDVPVRVRKALYAKCERDPRAKVLEHRAGTLTYVVDASAAQAAVTRELVAYRKASDAIVEDPEVQGGAATFKGTRILVHTIADLLKAGASAEELKEDYPHLTDTMIGAAIVYARAHPRRGRPKTPTWRAGKAASSRRYGRGAR